jgi:FlaG/FlaF family flagellin (archaellin)
MEQRGLKGLTKRDNNAVSPVIAVLLLAVIAISATFSSYLWYKNVQEETQTGTQEKVSRDLSRVNSEVRIIEVDTASNQVFVENTGGGRLHNLNLTKGVNEQINMTDVLDVGEIWVSTYSAGISQGDTLYVTTSEGVMDRYLVLG